MIRIMLCLPFRARRWQVLSLLTVFLALPAAGAEPDSAPAVGFELVVERDVQPSFPGKQRLISIPMPQGAQWCVKWNHSVAQFVVLDCYRNVAGQMVLERSHQPDFAAGLGHVLGRGIQVSDGEGGYWIKGMDEPVPGNRYALRVGAMRVNHRLVWPAQAPVESFSISEQAAGERVIIQLQAVNDQ